LLASAPAPALSRITRAATLEGRFLRLCRRHRIERPEANVRIGSDEVDFLWRERSLVVELDSCRYHGIRSAFETDRAREVRLKLLGFEVVRFTDRQPRPRMGSSTHSLTCSRA
jgi:very-short-patch-repair endonuclease